MTVYSARRETDMIVYSARRETHMTVATLIKGFFLIKLF